jgi:hypothetical protein
MARNFFQPCITLRDFEVALFRGTGAPIPVWLGERHDLLDGISLAETIYDEFREPPRCATGVLVGGDSLPATVRETIRPLASRWLNSSEPVPGTGSILLAGTYNYLRSVIAQRLIELTYHEGRDLFVLTGRDVHSLSWATAKQYVSLDHGEVGVFSELDTQFPAPGVKWFGAQQMDREDLQRIALETVWRRVLFHGNGKDDSLNLGPFTLCGLSPSGQRTPGTLGPKCAYGLGCFKAEDKLIPVHRIRTAEIVLANCFSGPLADHAMYDPKYVIMLNAVDGPAQTVISTLTACDAGRPENLAWLSHPSARGNAATGMNRALSDINPYPAFTQLGMSGGASAEDEDCGAVLGEKRSGPPLRIIGARLHGLLDSGLLPAEHPVRGHLERLNELIMALSARSVANTTQDRAPVEQELHAQVQRVDLALARRLSSHHDDPLLDFPTYLGERSVAGRTVDGPSCPCGRPTRRVVRRGRIPVVLDTIQDVCPRCGDVFNSFKGCVEMTLAWPEVVARGKSCAVRVTVTAQRDGIVHVGLVPSISLRVNISPSLRRVMVKAGEPALAEFQLAVDPSSTPQACFLTPFAVHDLGIATMRSHVNVVPEAERADCERTPPSRSTTK